MGQAATTFQLPYFIERGSGPPLLLIHGLMVTGEMFEPAALNSLAARHRLIVPDLRGHGRSRHLGPPYTTRQLALDLSRLLDHLGIQSAAIIGYSEGGAIAQQLVLDYPDKCERLVLACTFAYNMASISEWVEGKIAPYMIDVIGLRRFAKLGVRMTRKQMGEERAERMARLIVDQDQKLMVNAWRETMAFDSRQRLGEITCATLIIAGSKDIAVPIHHARMLHEGIHGSELVVLEGADHMLLWTRTEDFLRIVEEFLGH